MELQKVHILSVTQNNYSESLHTFYQCKKYSESTVGTRTHVKPVFFTLNVFAVYLLFSICISYTIGSNIAPTKTYLVAIGENLIKVTLWHFCTRVIHVEADKLQWVRRNHVHDYITELNIHF